MKTTTALITGLVALGFVRADADDLECPPLAAAIAEMQALGLECDSAAELAESLLKVQGHATLVGADGERREISFGRDRKIRLKDGGMELDLGFAPDQAAIEDYVRELGDLYAQLGPDPALIDKALAGLDDLDRFGAARIRGFVIDEDGSRHDFAFGNAADDAAKKFSKKMQDGGVMLKLRMAPGESAMALLRQVAGSPATPPPPAAGSSEPAAPELLEQALTDPETRSLLNEGLKDPAVQGLLKRGLEDPETMKLAEDALASEAARGLLGRFLGVPATPAKEADAPAPEPAQPAADDPRDAEIRDLKRELREQRLMLERLLERLGSR